MKKTKRRTDAVHLMRRLRDSLSEQMQDMTFEQQHKFIAERLWSHHRQPAKSR